MTMSVEWRDIPGAEGFYQASTDGLIRSLPRQNTRGKVLKGCHGKKSPYLNVGLSMHGVAVSHYVHHLVALTFHGPRPEGLEIRHLDGNPHNNAPANLAYGTRMENIADQRTHGTDLRSRTTHCVHGHEYTEQNTMLTGKKRQKVCRTCAGVRNRPEVPTCRCGHPGEAHAELACQASSGRTRTGQCLCLRFVTRVYKSYGVGV